MKAKKTKNAGLWSSVDDTNLSNNVYENYLPVAENYARSKGLKIVERYDVKHSDGSFIENPQIRRAIDDILDGKIQALITPKLSMLGRTFNDIKTMYDILEAHNTNLISISESFDNSNPNKRLLFHLLASIAELESELVKALGIWW